MFKETQEEASRGSRNYTQLPGKYLLTWTRAYARVCQLSANSTFRFPRFHILPRPEEASRGFMHSLSTLRHHYMDHYILKYIL